MADSDEEKQNYLRENILDKGYDAEDFVAYLTSKKGDEGVDLGNWSLNELKLIVQEYIFTHPKNIIPNNNQSQPYTNIPQMQPPNMCDDINNINMVVNNPNMNINNNLNNDLINNNGMDLINQQMPQNLSQNFMAFTPETEPDEQTDQYGITNLETIYCSISEKTELGKIENVHIDIALGEKIMGKLFSKAYMTYIITTSPLNFKVRRRYSDCEWLRQILISFFNSSVIPPIPKKNKIYANRFDENFLIKRMRTLEKFLNFLMEDPLIKESQIIYDFLSIDGEEKFNNMKKNYNNFKLPTHLRDYKSPTGKIDIAITEGKEIYYLNVKDNTEINLDLLSKLNRNLKALNMTLTSAVDLMNEISKNSQDLFLNSVKYGDGDQVKICYYQLNDMFKNWADTLKKQSNIINVNIREYFKYTKNTFRSMKEFLNVVENIKQNYYRSKKNLIAKKEELFKKSDVNKWDLGPNKGMSIVTLLKDKNIALPKMLCNETSAVINMKQIYGYYLNRANSEFERIRGLMVFGHRQNISDNSKKQITIISELFKNMSEIAVGSPKYEINNIEKDINKLVEPKEKEKDINKA